MEKSQHPVRRVDHLGFEINMEGNAFRTTRDRWEALREAALRLLRARWTSARELYRVTGRAVSLALAIGPAARIFTRALYADANAAPSWDGGFLVSEGAAEDLSFWASTNRDEFCTPSFQSPSAQAPVFFCIQRVWPGLGGASLAGNHHEHPHLWVFLRVRELRGLLGCLRAFVPTCRSTKGE